MGLKNKDDLIKFKIMHQKLKNLLGFKSLAENIDELNTLNKSFIEVEDLLDVMADEFTSKNEERKISIKDPFLDLDIKKSIENKFTNFYNYYNSNLSDLLGYRRKILKGISKIESRPDIKEHLREMQFIKKSFIEGKISADIFLNIMDKSKSIVKEVIDEFIEKSSDKKQNKVSTVMREFSEGNLKSSSGEKVTDRKQAQAIAMSEAGLSKADSSKKTIENVSKLHGVSVENLRKQLKMGIEVEKEHNSDLAESRKIALDHLYEFPDYYTRHKKMEKEAEDEEGKKEKAEYYTPEQGLNVNNNQTDEADISETFDPKMKACKVSKSFDALEILLSTNDITSSQYDKIIEKAKAGTYADNEMNRKLGRAGQKYGEKEDDEGGKEKAPPKSEEKESDKPKKEGKGAEKEAGKKESKKDDDFTSEGELKDQKEVKVDVPNDELKKLKEFASQSSAKDLKLSVQESSDPKIRAIAQEELDRRKNEEVATKSI